MKPKIILITLLLLLSSSLHGGFFIAGTYADKTSEFTVENKTWKSDYMVGIKVGGVNRDKGGIGFYADYKETFLFEDPKEETQYSYKIINLGLFYNFSNKISLMSGAGYTWEVLKDIEGEDSEVDNNNLNFNIGMMYYPYNSELGLLFEYDLIPKSFGFGIGYRF